MGKNRKYYICSPLNADTAQLKEKNRLAAIGYCEMISGSLVGTTAVAPHAYLPLILDDSVEAERELALEFGLKLLALCDAMVVCGNRISLGMSGEITKALITNKPIYVENITILKFILDIATELNCGGDILLLDELMADTEEGAE